MLLGGFGISGYRSFGEPMQFLAPLRKTNLLAGQNNAGKSNALRVAQLLLKESPVRVPTELEIPRFEWWDAERAIQIAVVTSVDLSHQIFEPLKRTNDGLPAVEDMLQTPAMHLTNDSLSWFVYEAQGLPETIRWVVSQPWASEVAKQVTNHNFNAIRLDAYGQASSDHGQNVYDLLTSISPLSELPPVKTIEAFRQISLDSGSNQYTPDGDPLPVALSRLQHPGPLKQHLKDDFEAINRLLRSVLDDPTASLEIDSDHNILVHRQGIVLPLEHLGTGVHQVTILGAVATLFKDWLICIEEPEVHLHPLLQRKLLNYLDDHTQNQYLIATHSAHLLDSSRAEIFHLQATATGSEIQRAMSPGALANICADLGYRPSDLLQANAVIWVEGPSDRIYIRHWIRLSAPELQEHIHYSIMFYGGRLLSHLSATDNEVDDFIRLRRLNRHLAVVIDSDKESRHARINPTKRRVRNEFDNSDEPGFAWVTDCRMIENYVPLPLLIEAVRKVSRATLTYTGDQWDIPLSTEGGTVVDKVKLAHHVCDAWNATTELNYDLKLRIRRTIHFIRKANGLNGER